MLIDLTKGISDYLKGFELINRLRLWKYVFFVGLISIIFGIGILFFGYYLMGNLSSYIQELYPFEWGKVHIAAIIKYLGVALLFMIGIFFYKYLVFILFVPFLGPISEKIEEHLTGRKAGYSFFNFSRLSKDISRGIRISLRLIYKEMLWLILLLLLGLFPLFSPFVPVFAFLIQAFYAGYANFDWALERFYNVRDRIGFVSQNRSLTLGNGIAFMVLLCIPVLGFFLAPVLSVGAATISVIERLQSNSGNMMGEIS